MFSWLSEEVVERLDQIPGSALEEIFGLLGSAICGVHHFGDFLSFGHFLLSSLCCDVVILIHRQPPVNSKCADLGFICALDEYMEFWQIFSHPITEIKIVAWINRHQPIR